MKNNCKFSREVGKVLTNRDIIGMQGAGHDPRTANECMKASADNTARKADTPCRK